VGLNAVSGSHGDQNLWNSYSTGTRGTAPAVDDDENDGSDSNTTSVERRIILPPVRRRDTVTGVDKPTPFPLTVPMKPLPCARLPDPEQISNIAKEFVDAQDKSRVFVR